MSMDGANLLQGTLDLLIPRALTLTERHGLGISRHVADRMEGAGRLSSAWGESENNGRAKFYRFTIAGRRQLQAEKRQ